MGIFNVNWGRGIFFRLIVFIIGEFIRVGIRDYILLEIDVDDDGILEVILGEVIFGLFF